MRALLAARFALALVPACAEPPDDDDHEGTEDLALGQNAGATMQGLATAGRWLMPDDVAAAGEAQDLELNDAPPWDDGTNCSGGPTPGALTFRDHLLGYFPQIASVGIYNCRVIAGTNSMSIHGVGRALDIMIPTIGGDADNDLGDPIAHWLIENAAHIGVQTVIWDKSIWRVSRNPKFGSYTGSNPHVDHLHVELNIEASEQGTPWFADPTGPVACPALPAAETIVDEDDDCFALFGPAQYWRTEAAGHGGSLHWTNAFENDEPSNWARWSLPFEQAGTYKIEAYVDPTWGVFASTTYDVKASGTVHQVVVDQGAANGWVDLGTYAFAATGDEEVVVRDDFAGAVAGDQHIVADALRATPVVEGAPPDDEPVDPPDDEPVDPPVDPPGDDQPTDPPPGDEPPPVDDVPPVDDDDPGTVGPASQDEVERVTLPPSTVSSCAAAGPATPVVLVVLAAALAGRRRRRRS